MKQLIFSIAISIVLISTSFSQQNPFSQQNSESELELEKRELRADYMNYLTSQGYRPSLDNDLDVKFKFEGETFYILVKNSGVFVASSFMTNNAGCNNAALKTVNKVNSRYRNITVYLSDDCDYFVTKSVSWLVNKDDYKGDVFEKSLEIVRNATESAQKYYAEYASQ